MGKEVSFIIRLDDKGTFKKVTMDAEELGKAVSSVQDEAEKAKRAVLTWSEASQAISVLQNTIGELQNTIADLTSAYQVQLVAETQLNTIMRQRMKATDAEIQSVKGLCSAQQELGVVGDEVQLSGAQQMATFLQNKQSLDVLIPAMNNLIAQQEGLNATTNGAVSIGNMMGKAMQGQVEVLQRVGITFTEAQKKVLQYGTESERAAMLAQVITDNVGNMNAELAKTDAGKQKQLENNLGDIKEQLGGLVQGIAPVITMLSQMVITGSGVAKLTTSLYASVKAMYTLTSSAQLLTKAKLGAVAVGRVLTAVMRGESVAATTAAVATRALSVAVKGLLVATGVGIAIAALGEAIGLLTSSSDKAAASATDMAEAENQAADSVKTAYDNTLKQTYGDMMARYEQLKAGWKSLKSEHEKIGWISKNKSAFNELKIKISSVSDAESAFEKNTAAVVDGFAKRAQAAAYAAKLTELYQRQIALLDKKNHIVGAIADDAKQGGRHAKEGDIVPESWRSERYGAVGSDGKWRFTKVGAERYNGSNTSGNKQVETIDTQMAEVGKLIDDTKKQMAQTSKDSGWITPPTASSSASATTPKATTTTQANNPDPLQGSIDYYEKQIAELRKRISATADEGAASAMQTELEQKEAELKQLKIRIGIEKPEPTEAKTALQQLQEQLQAAQKDFDNATTIEAKVKAQAKVVALQEQIDQATNGRLTITADVQPQYIVQGSIDDTRQSYQNAQAKAQRIQQDYEIGIIGKEEAQRQIDELNKQIEGLGKGLKPIEIDLDAKSFDKAMANIRKGWSGIQGIGSGIEGITDALTEDKNAWERISGVINGTLQVAEGIAAVVKLIDMLTASTEGETAATATNTAITATNTAASATNTAAKSGEAVANATASGAKLPFPANIAAIAAGVAAVVAALGMISGAFATGGIVGGNSYVGDKLIARVNSGEMILNARQQAQLFAIANGAGGLSENAESTMAKPNTQSLMELTQVPTATRRQRMNFRLRGRELVAAISNETKMSQRSRRKAQH